MKIPREVKLEVLRKWRRPPEAEEIVQWWFACGGKYCALCSWMDAQRCIKFDPRLRCPLQDDPEDCRLCCTEWDQCNNAQSAIINGNDEERCNRFYEAFRAMQRRVRKLEAEEK